MWRSTPPATRIDGATATSWYGTTWACSTGATRCPPGKYASSVSSKVSPSSRGRARADKDGRMTTNLDHALRSPEVSRRYVVVSSDGHAGPSLEHSLRPYCPSTHLEAFDDFVLAFRRGEFADG